MVASSDSVLAMIASPYSVGYAGDGITGHDDAIGGVDRVHDDVRDRDIQRNADHHDGGHPEVPQHRVEVGAPHRPDAVPPAQHQIALAQAPIRAARPLRACRERCRPSPRPMAKILALWLEPSPSGRRCTRQCTTRTPAARAAGSSRTMLGSATRRASSASMRQPGVRADDRALALLGDDRGVLGRREVGEWPSCAGDVVELGRPLTQCHIPFRVDLGERADVPRTSGSARFADRRRRWTGTAFR